MDKVFVKPNLVFELFDGNWHARGDLRSFESLLYKSISPLPLIMDNNGIPLCFSIPHPQDFDILSPEVFFGRPINDDLAKDLLPLLFFSGLKGDGTHSAGCVSKRYFFAKKPLINCPN
jgi:hypothetical protein